MAVVGNVAQQWDSPCLWPLAPVKESHRYLSSWLALLSSLSYRSIDISGINKGDTLVQTR